MESSKERSKSVERGHGPHGQHATYDVLNSTQGAAERDRSRLRAVVEEAAERLSLSLTLTLTLTLTIILTPTLTLTLTLT